jgi:hypothetical protein
VERISVNNHIALLKECSSLNHLKLQHRTPVGVV